jgi:dTDP-4-dehydrorhamnose reductase
VSTSFENSPLGNAHIPSQYVDNDPNETSEWRESLEAVAKNSGNRRAKYLMLELLRRSAELGLEVPTIASTDYINTIPPDQEPWFPGDEFMERRIRAFIRWNAAIMVHRAQKYGVEKIVYTGSASVYGNPSILPISENSGVYTLSPYATSKLAGENYCISFYESFNLPSAIVRYSNVYGTNQDPKNPYCGVVSKFFESAIKNEPIKIHGDGEQTRDFTFVKDTALATIEALINPKSTGGIFNTGSGGEISINDLAKRIIEISGSTSGIEYVDKRDIDNIRRRSVNIELIRRTLRWSPTYTIDKGLKETYQWILENLD